MPTEMQAVIDRSIRIEASPETVFSLLVEPGKMRRWMGSQVEIDPRPGGVYRVMIYEGAVASGEYLEVIPNEKVVFTWGWESGENPIEPGTTRVEISLEADGKGTLVRLRHFGLEGEEIDRHDEGWQHYLQRLQVAAEGGDPGPDPFAESSG